MANSNIDFPVSRAWAMWYDNTTEETYAEKGKQDLTVVVYSSKLQGTKFTVVFKVPRDDVDGRRWEYKAEMRRKWESAVARIVATPVHQPMFMQKGQSERWLTVEVSAEVYFL